MNGLNYETCIFCGKRFQGRRCGCPEEVLAIGAMPPRAVCPEFMARVYHRGEYKISCTGGNEKKFKSLWAMEYYYQKFCCDRCKECQRQTKVRR